MSEHPDPAEATQVAEAGAPTYLHLRSPGCSLVVELAAANRAGSSALPRVVHWGPLLDKGVDASALALAISPPIPHAAPDDPMRRHLLPMPVDGWRLRPGLRGARADGTAWSPMFAVRSVESHVDEEHGGGWLLVGAEDGRAELRLQILLTLHPSGVLEVEQSLHNVGGQDYLLTELAATLPIPARALEVLDLTGRWCRERLPQRAHLNMGAWSREGRRGRTGHDSPLY